ncbi:unnamed protein product [Ambrosiozyma monospora]|uniref:Unnamed protein product n=1 Tax=Ambrosiozyma monospora TaxID=43982 RepID=A0ACB5SVU9_AMBMO|nr:unnamed protein product [Ambrosiozyma monospora]
MSGMLKGKGITPKTTQGYDSQGDGIAERLNNTLLSAVRTNVFNVGLSNRYWTEACDYVVAMLNNVVVCRGTEEFGRHEKTGVGCQGTEKIETVE